MTDTEVNADLRRQLAAALESSARHLRMLERQGFQLDRMQDQLERALGEIAALRCLLNKPPPDEPPPKGAAPASTGADKPAAAPPVTPDRPKAAPKKKGKYGRNAIQEGLTRIPDGDLSSTYANRPAVAFANSTRLARRAEAELTLGPSLTRGR